MHNGRVIASAQCGTDLEQGGAGLFAHDIHGNLARPDHITVALFSTDQFGGDVIETADAFQYFRHSQVRKWFTITVDMLQGLGGQTHGKRSIFERGIGDHAVERSLQLSDAATGGASNKLDDPIGTWKTERLRCGAMDSQAIIVVSP